MSNEKQSEASAVKDALHQRVGFETVRHTGSETQVRLVGRVAPTHRRNWKAALDHLLRVEQESAWGLDISQSYFLRGDEVVFAWRIIIQARDGSSAVTDPDILPAFLAAVQSAPRAKHAPAEHLVSREVTEQPLSVIGGRPSGINAKGKGASSHGTLPAILQGRRG